MRKCPKCGYERTKKDDELVPVAQCPKCRVVYSKFETFALQKRIEELEKALREKESLEAEKEEAKAREDELRSRVSDVWYRVNAGQKCFIYEKVYIPVDSIVGEETIAEQFDISILERLGLEGWDIVAVVPRTIGVALTNQSMGSTIGSSWGAGMGGNIIGVHVLLKKELVLGLKEDFNKKLIDKLQVTDSM